MLILASGSPRRRELLQTLDVPFQVMPSQVDERAPQPGEDPAAYVLELARLKAEEVSGRRPEDVVLAADTDVSVDGRVLGKPADPDDALRMLQLLRGRTHEVTTAVVVQCAGAERAGLRTARVTMRAFGDDEARAYIATGEPMDKAGGYAVQEFGGSFVDAVEGCYNAVVGLPLCLTVELLRECGLAVSAPAPTCRHGGPST
jgi:nucleoside triphosphate pyrophosphatase